MAGGRSGQCCLCEGYFTMSRQHCSYPCYCLINFFDNNICNVYCKAIFICIGNYQLPIFSDFFHRSLQQTLSELKDYQHKHEYWQSQQERLLHDQAAPQLKHDQRLSYEWHRNQFDNHVHSGKDECLA